MDLVGETFLMSKFLIVILAILVLAIVLYSPNIYKLYKLATLYNEKSIAKNFISINKIFDTSNPVSASEKPFVFEKEEHPSVVLSLLLITGKGTPELKSKAALFPKYQKLASF